MSSTAQPVHRFPVRAASYIIATRWVIIALGAVIMAAVIIGQIRKDRFPAYEDIAMAAALPLVAYAVITIVILVGRALFSLKITPEALHGYTVMGPPITLRWQELEQATPMMFDGMPYLLLRGAGSSREMAIPMWMEDVEGFFACIEKYAPADSPLRGLLADMARAQGEQVS